MIREVLARYAVSMARVFPEDRTQTVGASDIGRCARRVFFEKNNGDYQYGAQRDLNHIDRWGATVRGSLIERYFWTPAMQAAFGIDLLYAGDEQRTFASGFLSATPDALLTNQLCDALKELGVENIAGDGSIVIECKSVDPRTNLEEAKPEHVYQAQVQLGLIRELTPHRPQYALIVYTDASFHDEVSEFVVDFDQEIYATAGARAAAIMIARSAGELAPEGWIAGGKECAYCPYSEACGRLRHAVPFQQEAVEPDRQFIAELSDLAREAKQYEADAEAATVKLRTTQHKIKERLRSRGLRRVVGNGVSVVWSPVRGRTTLDIKRIREDAAKLGLDLVEYETTSQGTDRLVIITHAATSAA
jgi:hypothetical protein